MRSAVRSVDRPERRWILGLYPSIGIAVGPPEWISYQIHGYLSLSDHRSFSLFAGYGYERGPGSETHMATLGWGGVRRLSGARPARGFYGKFLRYRRMRDFEHGIHHGLSVGSRVRGGSFRLRLRDRRRAVGADNHWAITAQVGAKIALPIIIPLSRSPGTGPDSLRTCMLIRLLVLFTLVPLLELYLLVTVGEVIGIWPTVALVVFTGALGAFLTRLEGLGCFDRSRRRSRRGGFPLPVSSMDC